MSDIVTTTFQAVRKAEATIEAIERDIAAIATARMDLTGRLPTLRADRVQAARSMLAGGGPRKIWQIALQAEQEAVALLADAEAAAAILEAELTQARWHANAVQIEARTVGLEQRLRRVVSENDIAIPTGTEFFGDVVRAYDALAKMGRADKVDRRRAHTFWIDRAGHGIPLLAFEVAALCHGDILIERGGHFTLFGLDEFAGRPAASLALNGDPTPSANKALITKVQQDYRGYQPGYHHGFRTAADFVGRVQ